MANRLIDRNETVLLVVDIQEKLAPYICQIDEVIRNTAAIISAAGVLEVPIVVTEQYAKGLGHTIAPISAPARDYGAAVFEKTHFDATREEYFCAAMSAGEKRQAVICGTEAHVCVLQSTAGLIDIGFQPFVVSDATSSRSDSDRDAGLARLRDMGARIVTTEMVIFEWLERADTQLFRDLLPVIRKLKGASRH